MAGYWKIEKEWVQEWGLTATECIVLADCLSWQGGDGRGVTQAERAERCGMKPRMLRYTFKSIMDKVEKRQDIATECRQKIATSIGKILPHKAAKNCHIKRQDIATSPHTPYNNVEEQEEKEERCETRTHVCDYKKEIFDGIVRGWAEHYRNTFGREFTQTSSFPAEVNAMVPVVKKLMEADGYVPTEDTTAMYTVQLFSMLHKNADDWQFNNWSLGMIEKQINRLIQNANGKRSTNKYAGTSDRMRASIAADLAAGK